MRIRVIAFLFFFFKNCFLVFCSKSQSQNLSRSRVCSGRKKKSMICHPYRAAALHFSTSNPHTVHRQLQCISTFGGENVRCCIIAAMGDSRETDPLACLQPLIAIIPQWKQSIQAPPATHTQPTSLLQFHRLTFNPICPCICPSISMHVAKKGAIPAVVVGWGVVM